MSNGTQSGGGPSPLVVGAVGVIVGAGIVVGGILAGFIAAGDEAPIRVKHGSIDFELLYKGKKWKTDGDRQHWKMRTGTRGSDDYALYITPSDAANCPGGLTPTGKTIRFVFSDGTNLQIKALNMKTKVSSDKDLDPSIDGSVISYRGTGGYISSVRVDGNEVCKFNAPDTKLNIVLLDQ